MYIKEKSQSVNVWACVSVSAECRRLEKGKEQRRDWPKAKERISSQLIKLA